MKQVVLGRTGLKVSQLGFGGLFVALSSMVDNQAKGFLQKVSGNICHYTIL